MRVSAAEGDREGCPVPPGGHEARARQDALHPPGIAMGVHPTQADHLLRL